MKINKPNVKELAKKIRKRSGYSIRASVNIADAKTKGGTRKERPTYKEEVSAPTNSAGAGGIAGIGVGPDGEPGVKKGKKSPILMTFRRWLASAKKKTT